MSDTAPTNLIPSIHAAPRHGVIAVTGGGSRAISELLAVPGASRTVLEAVVPYAEAALAEWVGGRVDSACSEPTARAMAMAAFERARALVDDDPHTGDEAGELFGVGCTASLASDRPKRGDHRLHVAVQTAEQTVSWSLILAKGKRTRAEEEDVAAGVVLHAAGVAAGVVDRGALAFDDGDVLTSREKRAPKLWRELLVGDGMTALVDPTVNPNDDTDAPRCERVLLPGAFNPAHEGHHAMAGFAAEKLGKAVTLELSISNVDKPSLDYLAIDERLQSIAKTMPGFEVWLTRLPTFVRKSGSFAGCTFVVGADTIARVGDPRYYRDTPALRDEAITTLAQRGCRFLVVGRASENGFQTLNDVSVSPELRDLCDGFTETDFRRDVSSTELRRQSVDGSVS